jgi:ribonuclease HI
MSKTKYYVVWEGRERGVFDDWVKCLASIQGIKQAKYKAYKSLEEANKAFTEGYEMHWGKGDSGLMFYTSEELKTIGTPKVPSICVNSSCDQATKIMTYKGVDTLTGELLFRQGPFPDCDQHIGEFLAIVHGLAYLKQQGSDIPVYSRSRHAMSWIQNEKQYGGRLPLTSNNEKVFELVKRANRRLGEHTYNNEVLIWNKRAWNHPGDLTVKIPLNEDPQVGQKL